MAALRSRFSDEEVDEISENSESESKVETDSTDYSSDSDNVFGETSSEQTSSLFMVDLGKLEPFAQTNEHFFLLTVAIHQQFYRN